MMKILSSEARKRRRRLRQVEELAVKFGNLQLIGILDPDEVLEKAFLKQCGFVRSLDTSVFDYAAKTLGVPPAGLRKMVTALMAGADPVGFSLADSPETATVIVLLYLSMQKESPALKN